MAEGGEALYWEAREKYEDLSWALTELESNKRFSSSPTRFRSKVMQELRVEVSSYHKRMSELEKTRRTDKIEWHRAKKPVFDTEYRFPDGSIIFGKGYHTHAREESSFPVVPIKSRAHAMKELSDSLANNVLLVGPERHELSPEERLKNSLIAAHVDDCLNLLKSNNPATPYWKLIKEATVKAKEKYVALGGERDQWSERMALTGAKSKRYSTSD
jgi:hypothetical protein